MNSKEIEKAVQAIPVLSDLEWLEPAYDDLSVKEALIYAELTKNEAEHCALELEYSRVVEQMTDIKDKIDSINEQYGDE